MTWLKILVYFPISNKFDQGLVSSIKGLIPRVLVNTEKDIVLIGKQTEHLGNQNIYGAKFPP